MYIINYLDSHKNVVTDKTQRYDMFKIIMETITRNGYQLLHYELDLNNYKAAVELMQDLFDMTEDHLNSEEDVTKN